MAMDIPALAAAITATIEEFDRALLQAQVDAVENPAERVRTRGLAPNLPREAAIAEVLSHAQRSGWLDQVIEILVTDGLENGKISEHRLQARAAGEADPGAQAPLQAILSVAAGFGHPELFYKRFAAAMRWTTLIYVGNKAEGSGVLVGPHLVLTAWHVVKDLFEWKDNRWTPRELPEPKAGQRPLLEVEFDNCILLGGLPRDSSRIAAVSGARWCVASSAPHAEELHKKLPADLSELNGFWDYAVIRLREAPGMARRWAELRDENVVPGPDSKMVLLQHPSGNPMRFGDHFIPRVDNLFRPNIPSLRFVHLANAEPGSSGGPCFDRQFALFGIHQGVWPHPSPGHEYPISNRGIPSTQIFKHIASTVSCLPALAPSESPVYHLGPVTNYAPVIGCDDFVARLWNSAVGGGKRITLIEAAPRRTGKSFRADLVTAALPDNGHLKSIVDMTQKADASSLALAICDAAAASLESLEPPETFGSGAGTWVSVDLVPKVLRALGNARGDRLVWLVFKHLDKTRLEGFGAKDLLLALLDASLDLPWLRLVLDGYDDDLPQRVQAAMETEAAHLPTEEEIAVYLRRCVAAHSVAPEELGILIAASTVFDAVAGATREERLEVLARLARRELQRYIEKANVPMAAEPV